MGDDLQRLDGLPKERVFEEIGERLREYGTRGSGAAALARPKVIHDTVPTAFVEALSAEDTRKGREYYERHRARCIKSLTKSSLKLASGFSRLDCAACFHEALLEVPPKPTPLCLAHFATLLVRDEQALLELLKNPKSGHTDLVGPGAKEEKHRVADAVGEGLEALEAPVVPPVYNGELLSDRPQKAIAFLTAELEERGAREVREALAGYLQYLHRRFKIPRGPRPKNREVEDIRDAVDDLEGFFVDLHNLALRVGRSLALDGEPVTLHLEQDETILTKAGRSQPFRGRSFPPLQLSE